MNGALDHARLSVSARHLVLDRSASNACPLRLHLEQPGLADCHQYVIADLHRRG